MTSKILILDIETAPNEAYVWGAWRQNISQKQWMQKSHILSFAAKWLDDDKIFYHENRKRNDRKIVMAIYKLLDEADIVVAHHGKKFDLPVIIGRGVVHGFTPPSPYFVVDTREIASKEFRMVSNSLANLCEEFGLPMKSDHKKFPGFDLWLGCLGGNPEAWEEMREYNIADVLSLEALYLRIRPYIRSHPHISKFEKDSCPKCGSSNLQWRGYFHTKVGIVYHKFCCNNCGGWGRSHLRDKDLSITNTRNV